MEEENVTDYSRKTFSPGGEKIPFLVKGSGSYPMMARTRTANRNKLSKRRSDTGIITGAYRTVPGKETALVAACPRLGSTHKKKKLWSNKRSVHTKVSRRKSLENLGLLVRNRCGTAKIQWPSEKKETDVFDLLPESCLQVRQLIRMKSRGGSVFSGDGGAYCDPAEQLASGDFIRMTDPDPLVKDDSDSDDSRSIPNFSPSRHIWKSRRNISVIVRIRPKKDKELNQKTIVFRTDPSTLVFDPKDAKAKDFYFHGVKQLTRNDFGQKRPNRNVSFEFDKVYGPEASNQEIFEDMLKGLTDHLIEGYNSTVFAYGATGSGKTHTMIGSKSNAGLTVLMVESLYEKIEELSEEFDCEVVCSYLEVYNETIKDLLRPERELSIREDGKKGIIISELSFYKPRGAEELLKLLRSGNKARTQHATDLNAESSRSHAVFEVRLTLKRKVQVKSGRKNQGASNNKVEIIKSKLVMVDLAGSERGTATGSSSSSHMGGFSGDGARQREGANINKSLLALASCISALADGKCHVPYRNSKLTRLLKDSLNGLCTTVMIANISPSVLTSEDTYNTLKYADRAKSILGPATKQKNVFVEDLMSQEFANAQIANLHQKYVKLEGQLEKEKEKRRLVSRQLEQLQRDTNLRTESGLDDQTGKEFSVVTEDQLSREIQQCLGIVEERGKIFADYVEFSSQCRFNEWAISCKKLKTGMADVFGRLPPENQNYVWFSNLKNEVNNSSTSTEHQGMNELHAAYASKLKALTEEVEMTRQTCLTSASTKVAIPIEDYLDYKRLSSEHAGNERMDQFYQQFSCQISNQLITSEITLMNALKLVKALYLQHHPLSSSLDEGYRELLDLVYGPGPPLPQDTNGDVNNATCNLLHSMSSPSVLLPSSRNPPRSRKSSPLMDDFVNMRKLVDRPLLVPLVVEEKNSSLRAVTTTIAVSTSSDVTLGKSFFSPATIYETSNPQQSCRVDVEDNKESRYNDDTDDKDNDHHHCDTDRSFGNFPTDGLCNLVKGRNSTSYTILFDDKKTRGLDRDNKHSREKTSESMTEDWTTVPSTSATTRAGTRESTSGRNVNPAQLSHSEGPDLRLADQALIKDYRKEGKRENPSTSIYHRAPDGEKSGTLGREEILMGIESQEKVANKLDNKTSEQQPPMADVGVLLKNNGAVNKKNIDSFRENISPEFIRAPGKVTGLINQQVPNPYHSSKPATKVGAAWEISASAEDDEVLSNASSNIPCAWRASQLSLCSGRSTISHLKAPFHTTSKTFTVSRDGRPQENMPVISGESPRWSGRNNETREYNGHQKQNQWEEKQDNYYSSNDEDSQRPGKVGGYGSSTDDEDNDELISSYSQSDED